MAKTYQKDMEENTRWGHWIVTEDVKFDSVTEKPVECHKDITVNPGASLSSQMHFGRGEVYQGVSGTTMVCVEDKIVELKVGDEVVIPRGAMHFSWNESDEPSKFHEMQYGPLCDEDDIKRGADRYKKIEELNKNDPGRPPLRVLIDERIRVAKDRYESEGVLDQYHANDFMPKVIEIMNTYKNGFNDKTFLDALNMQFEQDIFTHLELHRLNTPELLDK